VSLHSTIHERPQPSRHGQATISWMKLLPAIFVILALSGFALAQSPKSVTVPVTLDHNRIIIDVYLPLPDGTSKRVRAWVDTGNSEMMMSQRMAALFGPVSCDAQACTATPPREVLIGGMKISLSGVQSANAPAGVPNDVMVPGMSPEINLPATVLHNYDVVFDYANRQFTLGEPGAVMFRGASSKAQINPLGLIQIASKIDAQGYNLGLDTGSGISFVSSDLVSKWHAAHATWPFMKGAVGVANMFGTPDEQEREVLRIPSMQFGTATLQNVLAVDFAPNLLKRFVDRAGVETIGLLGGDAFRNYRVGVDYSHGAVYLDAVAHSAAPDMDVVGLTLHPEPDGRYTVLAILDVDGKPAVAEVRIGDVLLGIDGAPATGATLGQVWSLLGGTPGQTRTLTLERDGKRFTVDAPVRRFLTAESKHAVKSPRRNPHRGN
jgi:hypothetical protein